MDKPRYHRKIIRITAQSSPNVRRALAQIEAGQEPDGLIIVPGIISWQEYRKRLATWDKVRQTISLEAQFYEGAALLLFPPDWLNDSHEAARNMVGQRRKAKSIGVDPAEGGDKTAISVIDEHGLIELIAQQTPDTSVIEGMVFDTMRRYGVEEDAVAFDRGGGGKQIADRMRFNGINVRTISFGSIDIVPSRARTRFGLRFDTWEDRYTYSNRRAQMYGDLSLLLDPVINKPPFAIPGEYIDLRKQMSVIRKQYDDKQRLVIPPKHRNPGQKETSYKTLEELLDGRSPDELDSLVLATHAMLHPVTKVWAGAV